MSNAADPICFRRDEYKSGQVALHEIDLAVEGGKYSRYRAPKPFPFVGQAYAFLIFQCSGLPERTMSVMFARVAVG